MIRIELLLKPQASPNPRLLELAAYIASTLSPALADEATVQRVEVEEYPDE